MSTASWPGDPVPPVDQDSGIRRERRGDLARLAWMHVALAGLAVLQYDPDEGRGPYWLVCVGAMGLTFVLFVLGRMVLDGRRGRSSHYRLLFAIRAHLDPGLEVRPRAEQLASRWAWGRSAAWWLPLFAAPQLIRGTWEEPAVATAGALVMAAGVLGLGTYHHRLGTAAQRWLDHPPHGGFPYVPPPDQRPWTITPREGLLLIGLTLGTLVALVAGAVLAS
jgi:hypothetical protein